MLTDQILAHFDVKWNPNSVRPIRFVHFYLGCRRFTLLEFRSYVRSIPHECEVDLMGIEIGQSIFYLTQEQYGFFRRSLLKLLRHLEA